MAVELGSLLPLFLFESICMIVESYPAYLWFILYAELTSVDEAKEEVRGKMAPIFPGDW